MSDLIDTTEMYLRTIFELEEEGVVPLRARIAERIGHSGPTVSQTVARMERDGLLHVTDDRHLELTPDGRRKAMQVMRKHRLAERLLLDVIGLEWEFVHDEACRWEHVMSERVEAKLLSVLGDPQESPYGNPIPGLAELLGQSQPTGPVDLESQRPLTLPQALEATGAPSARPTQLTVRRLSERLQIDVPLMRRLGQAGLLPGARVQAVREGEVYRVRLADAVAAPAGADRPAVVELPTDVARHVFVDVPAGQIDLHQA